MLTDDRQLKTEIPGYSSAVKRSGTDMDAGVCCESDRATREEQPVTRATILAELKIERDRLRRAISALEGTAPRRGRPKKTEVAVARPKRTMSAAARRRIRIQAEVVGRAQAKVGLTGERMARSDQRHASILEKALRSLRLQRIAVRPGQAGSGPYAHQVGGFLLTDEQIVDLYKKNRLTRWGLQEFSKAVKRESE
jgi:hypothetical protein